MLKFTVRSDISQTVARKLAEASTKAASTVAVQVMKDTRPFVPALTESFSNQTRLDGSVITYPGPYARYLYYGKVMAGKPPKTATEKDLVFTRPVSHKDAQAFWFEASKAQNLEKWVRVADKAVKHGLNE